MNVYRLIISLLLMFSSASLLAINVSGLYQTSVTVQDETAGTRSVALKQAMQQVLIKLSGNGQITNQSGASEIINRSQDFVQQFRYQQSVTEQGNVIDLLVKFDEASLNQAIRNYALTLWGKERPAVLVWIAYETKGGRKMLSMEESPELLSQLEKAAESRGVPLLFPLFDLEDSNKLSVSDVWAGFEKPIQDASKRYQVDAILVGRITGSTGLDMNAKWTLLVDGQSSGWSTTGDGLLPDTIDALTDRMAEKYVNISNSGIKVINLTVDNVNSFNDYARVVNYLESIQAVTQLMVKQVYQGTIELELVSHGGRLAINQALQLGNVIRVNGNDIDSRYSLK